MFSVLLLHKHPLWRENVPSSGDSKLKFSPTTGHHGVATGLIS